MPALRLFRNPTASGFCIGYTPCTMTRLFPGPVMFWSTMVSCDPGDCEGAADAGARPAVIPATVATISGTTQVIFFSPVAALPFVLDGSLKPIAFAAEHRLPQLPDVPTFKESGVDFTMGTWFGLLAPALTPAPIIATLNKAVTASLDSPESRKVFASQGAEIVGSSPAEFGAFLRAESERLAKVIRERGIRTV